MCLIIFCSIDKPEFKSKSKFQIERVKSTKGKRNSYSGLSITLICSSWVHKRRPKIINQSPIDKFLGLSLLTWVWSYPLLLLPFTIIPGVIGKLYSASFRLWSFSNAHGNVTPTNQIIEAKNVQLYPYFCKKCICTKICCGWPPSIFWIALGAYSPDDQDVGCLLLGQMCGRGRNIPFHIFLLVWSSSQPSRATYWAFEC